VLHSKLGISSCFMVHHPFIASYWKSIMNGWLMTTSKGCKSGHPTGDYEIRILIKFCPFCHMSMKAVYNQHRELVRHSTQLPFSHHIQPFKDGLVIHLFLELL
jgi:hypothetical protein